MNLHEYQGKALFAEYGCPYLLVRLSIRLTLLKRLQRQLGATNGL